MGVSRWWTLEFLTKLNYESCEEGEASVEASSHGLLHLYELVSSQLYKRS